MIEQEGVSPRRVIGASLAVTVSHERQAIRRGTPTLELHLTADQAGALHSGLETAMMAAGPSGEVTVTIEIEKFLARPTDDPR